MKKCWICGRTGKDVDEEYTNKRNEFIAGWAGSGGSPDELIMDLHSPFGDDPIPVCVICNDAMSIIVQDHMNEFIDEHIKRVLKGLLLSSLRGAES